MREKLWNRKRTGFGIGKEIGRERDEATEKREWDFGRGLHSDTESVLWNQYLNGVVLNLYYGISTTMEWY